MVKKNVWFCYLVAFTSTLLFYTWLPVYLLFFGFKYRCSIPFKYEVAPFNLGDSQCLRFNDERMIVVWKSERDGLSRSYVK